MSDQQDIVARLRAYTQHDRPGLSSDLKNAADYIEQLRRELVAAIEQRNAARANSSVETVKRLRHDLEVTHRDFKAADAARLRREASLAELQNTHEVFVHSVMAAAGFPDEIEHHTKDDLRKITDAISDNITTYRDNLRRLFHGVCGALGTGIPPINTETIDGLIASVSAVANGHNQAMPTDLSALGHRPGTFIPSTTTERFDEIERRMAELESSMRRTDHRFDAVREMCATMAGWVHTPTIPVALKNISVAINRWDDGNG